METIDEKEKSCVVMTWDFSQCVESATILKLKAEVQKSGKKSS